MATYDAQCAICESHEEYVRPISECGDTPICCGTPMKKVILHAPRAHMRGKFEAFKSNVDGTIINGSRDLEEHNRRNNVVCMADGYSDADIRAGNLGNKGTPVAMCKNELRQDIAEAHMMVRDGYKPNLEVLNDN